MRQTLVVIALSSLMAISGCQHVQPRAAPDRCSSEDIERLTKPRDLHDATVRCEANAAVYALNKLNRLPPPSPPALQLQQHKQSAISQKVSFEADVFFYSLESYPADDIAFQKLNELLMVMSKTYEVIAVEVTGYTDPNEADIKSVDLARMRAQFVADYLTAAGLSPTVYVSVKTSPARHPDTAEGRARDRSASISALARRDKR